MLKIFEDNPTPSSLEVGDMKRFLEKLQTAEKTAEALYIRLAVEIAKYSEEQKRKDKTEEAEIAIKNLQSKSSILTRKGEEYISKLIPSIPAPDQIQTSIRQRNIPLERLPLPTFKGNKMDFLRFRQEFEQHVKYESQEERMLALKTKCLLKAADKKRVANELTLSGCWKKLDDEYGDIDTLVAEIFSKWSKLKAPTTDKDFIAFVEEIEHGLSALTSLGHEKEMDSSYSSVMLEQKLSSRLKNEFSKSFISEESPNKNRMKSLLKFIQMESRANANISEYVER